MWVKSIYKRENFIRRSPIHPHILEYKAHEWEKKITNKEESLLVAWKSKSRRVLVNLWNHDRGACLRPQIVLFVGTN